MEQTYADTTIVGRLSRAPRPLGSSLEFCELHVAVNFPEKSPAAGYNDAVQYHRVVIFRKEVARFALDHLQQGDTVKLKGVLRPNRQNIVSGQPVETTEIHVDQDGSVRLMQRRTGRGLREPA